MSSSATDHSAETAAFSGVGTSADLSDTPAKTANAPDPIAMAAATDSTSPLGLATSDSSGSLKEPAVVSRPAYEPGAQLAPAAGYQSPDDYPSGPYFPRPLTDSSPGSVDDG
jgi:hypothetical protein